MLSEFRKCKERSQKYVKQDARTGGERKARDVAIHTSPRVFGSQGGSGLKSPILPGMKAIFGSLIKRNATFRTFLGGGGQ